MPDIDIPANKDEFRYFILEVIATLVALMEEKDPFLKTHSERVANNSANFCETLKIFDEQGCENIYFAGLLHDIGLIGVPLETLKKADRLSDDELIRIKKHPIRGEKILSNLGYLKEILPMIRHHHETMDGSGYPDGLEGGEIPLGGRILCLFNHFDNLAYPRSSEKAMGIADAMEAMKNGAGKLFDRNLIPDFLEFIESNSGNTPDFLLKQEAISMKKVFTEILKNLMTGKMNPPVMPQVVRQVQRIIKLPSTSADDLAKIIEMDPVISLRLISVANSPVYRGINEIRNVKNAIPRLGIKETLNLVVAISNKSLYETDKVQFKILMDKLWGHSLASAFAAKLIARNLKLEEPEDFFLMGLTHDIGKIILLKSLTAVSKHKILNMDAVQANIQEAHISLGGLFVKRWGYDEKFVKIITHHEDTEFSEDVLEEILVVNLANMLTRSTGFSLFNHDVNFAELRSARILKLDPETIESIGVELKQIMRDIAHLF